MFLQRSTILTAIGLVLTVAAPARSQRLAPSGVTRHDVPVGADTLSSTSAEVEGSRVAAGAHGALIGAGVGAIGGLATALVLSASATDHSEDGVTYFALATIGAFVGLVGGAIIGAAIGR